MKFWQLVSVCREQSKILRETLDAPQWAEYLELYNNFDDLVKNQVRKKLDLLVPDELVIDTLKRYNKIFYISEGYLRLHPFGSQNLEITMLEVFCQYGGDYIEEVMEKGSVKIGQ